MVVLVGFAACCLLFCGGTSKARPGNYTLLSCTCELQSSWASVCRRPPGDRNLSAHSSHVAFKGGRAGNQMKRQQQCKTTAVDLPSRIGDMTSTAPGLDVPITSGPEPSASWTGPTSFYRARSMRMSSVVVLPLSCNYGTIGSNVPAMQ